MNGESHVRTRPAQNAAQKCYAKDRTITNSGNSEVHRRASLREASRRKRDSGLQTCESPNASVTKSAYVTVINRLSQERSSPHVQ